MWWWAAILLRSGWSGNKTWLRRLVAGLKSCAWGESRCLQRNAWACNEPFCNCLLQSARRYGHPSSAIGQNRPSVVVAALQIVATATRQIIAAVERQIMAINQIVMVEAGIHHVEMCTCPTQSLCTSVRTYRAFYPSAYLDLAELDEVHQWSLMVV